MWRLGRTFQDTELVYGKLIAMKLILNNFPKKMICLI